MTLQENGNYYCVYDALGDKRTFKITDQLFIDSSKVQGLKDATKHLKYRPEFPSHLERYSFLQTSPPGSHKLDILMINEQRCEFIDREVLGAIKRGQVIDFS